MVEGRKWICADGVGMGEMNELGTGVIGTDLNRRDWDGCDLDGRD